MKIYLGLILFFLLSCQNRQGKNVASNNNDSSQIKLTEEVAKDTVELEEVFIDSLTIGRTKNNKVEVYKYRTSDSNYVDIKFYTKQTDNWKLNQQYNSQKTELQVATQN